MERVGRVLPARFFVWFANGWHRWEDSVDQVFNSGMFPTDGPVIVIDQRAVGNKLVERAGRPFVLVEVN